MEQKERKPLHYYMRLLHRDIGFLVLGLTIVYCVSGILLIFRDTDLFKHEVTTERTLSPNLSADELGQTLHQRGFSVSKDENGIIYFQNGTYNKITGVASYTSKELPLIINKFNSLHKSASRNWVHWLTTLYGILLLFLAISSFWMFKPSSKLFRRGMYFAGSGIALTIVLLLLLD